MNFTERSLVVGKGFQPKPSLKVIQDPWTLIVVNAWGQADVGEKITEIISESLTQPSVVDDDTTKLGVEVSPKLEPTVLDQMKGAILKAHDYLLKEANAEEWTSMAEVSLLRFENHSVQWVSVGKPHIFMRTSSGIEPMNYTPDPNWHQRQSAPLALQAIGLDQSPFFHGGVMSVQKHDQIILVSAGAVPTAFYLQDSFDLSKVANLFAEFLPKTPAWFCLLE
ncbi:MAG: hypothetical protein BroJett040_04090 [Oligoflexia bacterium]|nr:MAG: hypothetical protein BroJett040_04090 [Oligoflexia bacterium]